MGHLQDRAVFYKQMKKEIELRDLLDTLHTLADTITMAEVEDVETIKAIKKAVMSKIKNIIEPEKTYTLDVKLLDEDTVKQLEQRIKDLESENQSLRELSASDTAHMDKYYDYYEEGNKVISKIFEMGLWDRVFKVDNVIEKYQIWKVDRMFRAFNNE